MRECPFCGRLVAEQIPGSLILCPTCGATAPNLAAWNRRVDDVAQVVGIARDYIGERYAKAVAILASHHCAEGCEVERYLEERE